MYREVSFCFQIPKNNRGVIWETNRAPDNLEKRAFLAFLRVGFAWPSVFGRRFTF